MPFECALTGQVGTGKAYRVYAQGEVSVKELRKMIHVLTVQCELLEDDDAPDPGELEYASWFTHGIGSQDATK